MVPALISIGFWLPRLLLLLILFWLQHGHQLQRTLCCAWRNWCCVEGWVAMNWFFFIQKGSLELLYFLMQLAFGAWQCGDYSQLFSLLLKLRVLNATFASWILKDRSLAPSKHRKVLKLLIEFCNSFCTWLLSKCAEFHSEHAALLCILTLIQSHLGVWLNPEIPTQTYFYS